MSLIDQLVAANQRRADAGSRELSARPQTGVAVVTCMDARIDLVEALGLRRGDVHVIRNAGAAVTDDVLRSLLVSQRLLGTKAVMLIAHRRCGMQGLDANALRESVERDSGDRISMDIGDFSDLNDHVRRGVRRIRDATFLPHRNDVRGFVLDVDTLRLSEVRNI